MKFSFNLDYFIIMTALKMPVEVLLAVKREGAEGTVILFFFCGL
jgi:hypothetical protein